MRKRWGLIATTLLASAIAVGLPVAVLSARTSAQVSEEPLEAARPTASTTRHSRPLAGDEDKDPPPLGEPCGCGEQLPPWVICLHGTVSLAQPSGQAELLDGYANPRRSANTPALP